MRKFDLGTNSASDSTVRRRYGCASAIEALESRQLLSTTSAVYASPFNESVKPSSGITPATTSSPTGYSPQQIRQAYGFDRVTFGNGVVGDGAGTTIAIVDAYDDPNIANDLHQFNLAFGLPDATFTKVNQFGGTKYPVANSGWITEIALDVEWAHAIAPKANILLVEADSNSYANLMTAVDYARNAPGVVAVSMSWGSAEFAGETAYDNYFTTPAGHPGVTFIASSGDSGAPASYPSSSPNVLSVGGTTLSLSQGNYVSESGWSGSGGGISLYEPQPAFQNQIVTQSRNHRTTPDVAYDSNPKTGFPVYDSYNNGSRTPWGQWGGTSDAAPQWAGMIAMVDQLRAISGLDSLDGRTELLPALYQLPSTNFHDVTVGTSTGSPKYSAAIGYDLVTGRGSPIADLMVIGLAGQSNTPAATQFELSVPSSIGIGAPFSVTVKARDATGNVFPGYLGTVQFTSTDSGNGVVLPGNYQFTAADKGVHSFSGLTFVTSGVQSVRATDSVNPSVTGSASLSVIVIDQAPVLLNSSAVTYVKNQSATAMNTSISISAPGRSTLAFGAISITTGFTAEDVLSFVNDDHSKYGDITGLYDSQIGVLTLTSPGSNATLTQFQSALRAITYFNLRGGDAIAGTRTIAFQVSDGTRISNAVTSSVTVINASTVSTIASASAKVIFGQSVKFTATIRVVPPGTGTPTATAAGTFVSFMDGSNPLPGLVSYSVVNNSLVATVTATNLSAGIHSITAIYSGDKSNFGCTSFSLQQTVLRAGTKSTILASTAQAISGLPVTFTATISVVPPGAGTPTAGTGTAKVTFMDGKVPLDGAVEYRVASGNLVASLTTTSLAAGNHSVIAVYSRDANFIDCASAPVKLSIASIATTTSLSSSLPSAVFGQSVILTAIVDSLPPGTGTPTGGTGTAKVQFTDGNKILPGLVTYEVSHGKLVARLTTSSLTAGSHLIQAVYSGDSNFRGSRSPIVVQTIARVRTTTVLTSSADTVAAGNPITFTAMVDANRIDSGNRQLQTGTSQITFMDGKSVISGIVNYRLVNRSVVATLTTSSLKTGLHSVTAIYVGNSNFLGSLSDSIPQVIA